MKFDEAPEAGSKINGFLKLKDGESIVGILQGDPITYYAKWNGTTYEPSTKEEGGSFKFRINFVQLLPDKSLAPAPIIWEQGATVYNFLKDMNEDFPLDQTFIKVKRSGTGTDTEYMILPVPQAKYETYKKKLEEMELIKLEAPKPKSKDQNQGANSPDFDSDDEIPF